MIIVRRIANGVRSHWDIRASEWLMLFPALGMGVALSVLQPDMFDSSPSFATIAKWNGEDFWGFWVLVCATIRLIALVVNGTFDEFRYSPHMRLVASLVGVLFWSQFTLGFVNTYLGGAGSLSAVFAYTTFCLAELLNMTRSWTDISRGPRKR